MGGSLIGREGELAAAAEFLTELEDGPTVLVLAGAPGIGKTTLWQETVARARASSFVVLSARPVEGEAGLAFAGLADLLEPVAEQVLPELPEPQRRALAVALLREGPGGGVVDQRAVCAATTAALKVLADRGPVVVAVDDLQWLDRPSARVLEFATRRVAGLPAGVVASERVERRVRLPIALDRAVPEGRFRRVELGPLSGWPRKFVGGPSSGGGLKPEFRGGTSGRLPACRDVPGSTRRSTRSWRNSLRPAWTSTGNVPVS